MRRNFEDRVEDRLDSIDKTLVRNTESLEYHIKRTNDLQSMVEMTSKHVIVVQGIFKAIMALVAVVAAGTGIAVLLLR